MAPTAITPVSLTNYKTSVVVDHTAWPAGNATDGNTVVNGGSTLIGMFNSGASSRTVVLKLSDVDGNTTTGGVTYTIAAGVIRYVPLGPSRYYGDPALLTPSHAEVKMQAFLVG
jgi:hypothetical protein